MKNSNDYLEAANSVVKKITTEQGIEKHRRGDCVFIDVRDSGDIVETGSIQDALRIPRGFIEFAADDKTPYHEKQLTKDAEIILVCGAGGQAALTGYTLIEMGYENVSNVGGKM